LALSDRVARYATQQQLWTAETRVVAAVSGGSDSVALAFLLHELAARDRLVFAGLAHLNHHLRGADADADAAFCRALAGRLGVPAVIGDADVAGDARTHHVSLEVAGRHARQRFYEEALASVNADRVAVAHTRDDQAETVILRLTRGAGAAGLGAMAPSRGLGPRHVVRPLLDVARSELQEFLRARNETWREDATNRDRNIPRNRIRHAVMPELRAINAQADSALARAAEILRGEEEFLERLANAAFLRCVETLDEQGTVKIDVAEFSRLHVALARRVGRYALETANPERTYGLEEVDAFCRAITAETGAPPPDLSVERFGAAAVLVSRQAPQVRRALTVDPLEFRLDVPGTVEAPRGAWTLSADGPFEKPASIERGANEVVIDAGALGSHLIVRYRRPGDRLTPLGAPGRKKVQDVLVDRKVPRDDRDAVPIVTTEAGEIVWVAGEVLADPFRVTPLTRSVVVLTLRR
jgi:tRNA(Ile)-lysidine synthase